VATLEVQAIDSVGIAFGLHNPISSIDELYTWDEIVRKGLLYAYLNRPACLITVAPQPWSLGRELSDAPARRIDGQSYLLVFVASCSAELLTDVAESEDFKRGLLWLVPFSREDEVRAYDLIHTMASSNSLKVPQTDEELLIRVGDGATIWWLNPYKPPGEMILYFRHLAQSVGWACIVKDIESSI
jgi:hypothetical protein